MTKRAKTVYVPGLIGLVLSAVWAHILQSCSLSSPQIVMNYPPLHLVLHLPWLWGLVAISGLVAYWSRRAGGGRGERLVVSLFPVFTQMVAYTAVLPFLPPWSHPLSGYVNRVVIPGIFLLIGTIPFLRADRAKTLPPAGRPGELTTGK